MSSSGDRPLGVVVVGTGFGCLTHVPALRDAGFEVKALVGRDPEKTKARAERFEVPLGLTSLDEALALDGVDAVSVVTPPHSHRDLVVAAVEAGKHVVCEKPFATDAGEAQRMLDAAEAAGVVHLLGTEFRFGTGQALLRRVVQRGDIGEPRMAMFLLEVPLIADHAAEVPDWWEDRGEGGGWFGAHGSHWIDQVQSMLGPITGVSAALPVVSGRPMTAEDTFTVHFRTASGVEGILHSSAGSRGPMLADQRVTGTKGSAWIAGDEVHVATAEGSGPVEVPADLTPQAPVPPPMDLMVTAYDWMHSMGIDRHPYARLFGAFRDRILGNPVPDDPPPATFADGVLGMKVMDAVRRADREGTWVPILT
jgi:predicted dehydrogenase